MEEKINVHNLCLPVYLLPQIKAVGEKIRKEVLDKMERIKKANFNMVSLFYVHSLIYFTMYFT